MKTKYLINFFTICLVLSIASSLSAKNQFEGSWANDPSLPEGLGISAEIGEKSLEAGFWGPGGSRFEASYVIKGDSLHYTVSSGDYYDEKKNKYLDGTGKKGVCKIEKVSDSIYFQERLKCTGQIGEYIDRKHLDSAGGIFRKLLSEGTPRKIQGIEALSILKKGKVNDTAYLRSAPNVSSKPLNCVIRLSESTGKPEYEGQVIAKGREMFVLARTKTKFKVQKWENFWYYVESNPSLGKECGPGWMYGEFITLN